LHYKPALGAAHAEIVRPEPLVVGFVNVDLEPVVAAAVDRPAERLLQRFSLAELERARWAAGAQAGAGIVRCFAGRAAAEVNRDVIGEGAGCRILVADYGIDARDAESGLPDLDAHADVIHQAVVGRQQRPVAGVSAGLGGRLQVHAQQRLLAGRHAGRQVDRWRAAQGIPRKESQAVAGVPAASAAVLERPGFGEAFARAEYGIIRDGLT